jgi:hypothetical protein
MLDLNSVVERMIGILPATINAATRLVEVVQKRRRPAPTIEPSRWPERGASSGPHGVDSEKAAVPAGPREPTE